MTHPTLWPRALPVSIRRDWRRSAEVRVYDALAAQLGAGWSVFYSRPWFGETPTGAEIDGECDFVVAHPDFGVLTIEVKGGGISYEPERGVWKSRDRHGISYTIKDPVEQARRSKHELLRKARAERGWPNSFVRFRHGVIFPDISTVPQQLGADKPREIFAARPDLDHIADWVRQRLSGGKDELMGSAGLRVLEALLAMPFQLRMPLSFVGADDDQVIHELTPRQFQILTAFGEQRRTAIGGGAGTGKTVLAAEDARRQAESGLRTLMTCGSERLCVHLGDTLADSTVEVATFSTVAERLGREAGLLATDMSIELSHAAELVVDSLALRPDLAFDAVIVDEAQDFPSHVWVAIDALASRTSRSVLHAYFDSNQRIYGELRTQFDGYALGPVRLDWNLRNTQNIHEATHRFYQGPPLTPIGPIGTAVHWISADENRLEQAVTDELKRLHLVERVAWEDIAVLCAGDAQLDRVSKILETLEDGAFAVSTISDFKGLERRFVVLIASREMSDLPELAYVALSRARVHLSVIGSQPLLNWLMQK